MSAPLEHLRLSQQGKEQLIKLKRLTGIEHWNVLCRWGLCLSLAEASIPPNVRIPADSNLEMTWKVFAGPYGEALLALLKQRCVRDNLETDLDTVGTQLRLHVHRGIGYLAARKSVKDISGLVDLVK